jgi:signal transduction histidine kinase
VTTAPAPPRARSSAAPTWDDDCLDRERREARILLACAGVLIPAWVGIDVLLEPALARPFAALRLPATALCWFTFAAVGRARHVSQVRAFVALAVVFAGSSIAVMLPHVRYYAAYLFGFSLCFWTPGALLSWPVRYNLAASTWLLLALAVASAAWPEERRLADHAMAAFYLASATLICSGMTFVHRRAMRCAFVAARLADERNAELQAALDRLHDAQARLVSSEKLSALGRLLAGLSHEINNPVNVLQNNLEPLRGYLARLVDAARVAGSGSSAELAALRARWRDLDLDWIATDVVDATETMREAVDRIRQVHRDLRAFVRGDAPDMIPADVNEGLRATAALVSRRLPDGVEVDVALAPLPPLRCHPGQLNQVWHNLIQNAVDAVGERGRVTVSSRAVGDRLVVAVADTGPGIEPENRGRLFEPFFTTKDVGAGTGLGLATSYEIVRRHGGSLSLDAGYDAGARFVVELPVSSA